MKSSFKQLILITAACLSLGTTGFALAQDDSNTNNPLGQETAGQYVDNSALTLKVKAKLMADDTVKSLPITVNSYKGIVQLCGFVDDMAQVREAAKVARSVEGVKQVKNCLMAKTQIDKSR